MKEKGENSEEIEQSKQRANEKNKTPSSAFLFLF